MQHNASQRTPYQKKHLTTIFTSHVLQVIKGQDEFAHQGIQGRQPIPLLVEKIVN